MNIDLAETMVTNVSTITSLNLASNNISFTSGLALSSIVETLGVGQALSYLNLSSNPLGDRGVAALSRGLMHTRVLALVLSDCGIAEKGFRMLSSVLMQDSWTCVATGLRVLDVSRNSPGVWMAMLETRVPTSKPLARV